MERVVSDEDRDDDDADLLEEIEFRGDEVRIVSRDTGIDRTEFGWAELAYGRDTDCTKVRRGSWRDWVSLSPRGSRRADKVGCARSLESPVRMLA